LAQDWLGRIWQRIRGIFRARPKKKEIDPAKWRRATRAELEILGRSPKTRIYILKSVKRVRPGSQQISVRTYQQAQRRMKLEHRAKLYRSQGRPYKNIPWPEMPKYYKRVRGKIVQLIVLGATLAGPSPFEGQRHWRTIGVFPGDDLPDIVDRINSRRGYKGFNRDNPPDLAGLWVRRRP
jgi:hypothetical protein